MAGYKRAKGLPGPGSREGGGNCRRRREEGSLDRQGGGQTEDSGLLPSQFIPYY